MIERQIDSPMPMPLDFVVKKVLNTRSVLSAENPIPQSVTVIRTCSASSCSDRIRSSRGRSVIGCMASMPFITRLRITCCSWTLSARMTANVSACSTRSATREVNSSCCTKVSDSVRTSLRLSGAIFVSVFFASARMRRMTSPARVPSRTIVRRAACASSMLGGSQSSQLMHASALNMTQPSG